MAVVITWTDVTTAYPLDTALSSVPTATQAVYLEWVGQRTSSADLGDITSQVQIHLAAHLGSLFSSGGSSGPAGPVISESVDGVSRSYATPASLVGGALSSTVYGQQAAALMENNLNSRLLLW